MSAFNTIDTSQGIQAPFISNAAGYANSLGNFGQSPYAGQISSASSINPNILANLGYDTGRTNMLGIGNAINNLTGTQGPSVGGINANTAAFMNPYLQNVVGATQANINENNAEQQQQVIGNAISSGAWGGDRSAIAQSELARQQGLASEQTIANLENQGYTQAQQEATGLGEYNSSLAAQLGQAALQGQIGAGQLGLGTNQIAAGLGQANANLGLMGASELGQLYSGDLGNAAQLEGGLGQQALQGALTGASAQMQSGAVQQAQNQAIINAAMQQYYLGQQYPFQTGSYLSNIAEGLGSQQGGTTNAQVPSGNLFSELGGLGLAGIGLSSFLSDVRSKENIEAIGKTFDGQSIYRYNYKGDPRGQIGLMAQEVEHRHPSAVEEMNGLKGVNYWDATEDAARRGHFAFGGAPGFGSGAGAWGGGFGGYGGFGGAYSPPPNFGYSPANFSGAAPSTAPSLSSMMNSAMSGPLGQYASYPSIPAMTGMMPQSAPSQIGGYAAPTVSGVQNLMSQVQGLSPSNPTAMANLLSQMRQGSAPSGSPSVSSLMSQMPQQAQGFGGIAAPAINAPQIGAPNITPPAIGGMRPFGFAEGGGTLGISPNVHDDIAIKPTDVDPYMWNGHDGQLRRGMPHQTQSGPIKLMSGLGMVNGPFMRGGRIGFDAGGSSDPGDGSGGGAGGFGAPSGNENDFGSVNAYGNSFGAAGSNAAQQQVQSLMGQAQGLGVVKLAPGSLNPGIVSADPYNGMAIDKLGNGIGLPAAIGISATGQTIKPQNTDLGMPNDYGYNFNSLGGATMQAPQSSLPYGGAIKIAPSDLPYKGPYSMQGPFKHGGRIGYDDGGDTGGDNSSGDNSGSDSSGFGGAQAGPSGFGDATGNAISAAADSFSGAPSLGSAVAGMGNADTSAPAGVGSDYQGTVNSVVGPGTSGVAFQNAQGFASPMNTGDYSQSAADNGDFGMVNNGYLGNPAIVSGRQAGILGTLEADNRGMPMSGIAAMAGNFNQESGAPIGDMYPGAINSIGATGLAQDLGPRKAGLLSTLGANSGDLSGTMNAQLGYDTADMTKNYPAVTRAMYSNMSLPQKVNAFGNGFEVPGTDANGNVVGFGTRLADAQQWGSLGSALGPMPSANVTNVGSGPFNFGSLEGFGQAPAASAAATLTPIANVLNYSATPASSAQDGVGGAVKPEASQYSTLNGWAPSLALGAGGPNITGPMGNMGMGVTPVSDTSNVMPGMNQIPGSASIMQPGLTAGTYPGAGFNPNAQMVNASPSTIPALNSSLFGSSPMAMNMAAPSAAPSSSLIGQGIGGINPAGAGWSIADTGSPEQSTIAPATQGVGQPAPARLSPAQKLASGISNIGTNIGNFIGGFGTSSRPDFTGDTAYTNAQGVNPTPASLNTAMNFLSSHGGTYQPLSGGSNGGPTSSGVQAPMAPMAPAAPAPAPTAPAAPTPPPFTPPQLINFGVGKPAVSASDAIAMYDAANGLGAAYGGRIGRLGGGIIPYMPTQTIPYGTFGTLNPSPFGGNQNIPVGQVHFVQPPSANNGQDPMQQYAQAQQLNRLLSTYSKGFARGGRAGYDDGGSTDQSTPDQNAPISGAGGTSGMPASATPTPSFGFNAISPQDRALALMSAGFGMMSSRSPFALQGIGEGAQQGLNYLMQQRAQERANAETQSNIEFRKGEIDLKAKELGLQAAAIQRQLQAGAEAAGIPVSSVGAPTSIASQPLPGMPSILPTTSAPASPSSVGPSGASTGTTSPATPIDTTPSAVAPPISSQPQSDIDPGAEFDRKSRIYTANGQGDLGEHYAQLAQQARLNSPAFKAKQAEAEGTGKALGELPEKLETAASAAQLQNNVLTEMTNASHSWQMGWGAPQAERAREVIQSIGHAFGVDMTNIDRPVQDYQDFVKLAGNLQRNALAEVSTGGTRGGVQLANLFARSLPSPEMSQGGFDGIATQLKGVGDFTMAKQQGASAWAKSHGTLAGFQADWNKNVSPTAFVMHRMSVESPADFTATLKTMAAAPGGKAYIADLITQMRWANQNGLFGQ